VVRRGAQDGSYATRQVKTPAKALGPPNWMWPLAVTVVSLAAIGVGGFLYFTKLEMGPASKGPQVASGQATPSPAPSAVAAAPAPAPSPAPAAAVPAPPAAAAPPVLASNEQFATANVPFVRE